MESLTGCRLKVQFAEFVEDGAWNKRLHPGWAAQSGIRAALLAKNGFTGPRTVFEGVHGLFHHVPEGVVRIGVPAVGRHLPNGVPPAAQ